MRGDGDRLDHSPDLAPCGRVHGADEQVRALGDSFDPRHVAEKATGCGAYVILIVLSIPSCRIRGHGLKGGKFVLADTGLERHHPGMPSAPRNVVILAFPGVQSLDVTGPLEVFAGATELIKRAGRTERPYEISVVAPSQGTLRTSSGLTITPDATLAEASRRPIDTFVVAGGRGSRALLDDNDLARGIETAARRARRTAGVCTGALLLAAAGLLDGRRATTHWGAAAELARRFPSVKVDPTPIYIHDRGVWTSAGVTAGMDLALALVEQDLERDTALAIARHLVLFLRRPGNQAQFSATLAAQAPAREPLREVQRFVIENLAADLTVEALAARAAMSPRHFARSFRADTGITPARYVERIRLEGARRLLEDTTQQVAAIAAICGFGTAETLRRVFVRSLGVGPSEYRRRFQGPPIHSAAA